MKTKFLNQACCLWERNLAFHTLLLAGITYPRYISGREDISSGKGQRSSLALSRSHGMGTTGMWEKDLENFIGISDSPRQQILSISWLGCQKEGYEVWLMGFSSAIYGTNYSTDQQSFWSYIWSISLTGKPLWWPFIVYHSDQSLH